MPHADDRIWLLDTPNTAYVVALDEEDRLMGLHWGARLEADQASDLVDLHAPRARPVFDGLDARLDLNPAAAFRFGQTGLRLRFADGTAELELRYTGAERADGELALAFEDRHYPIDVRVVYRTFADTDVIERRLALRNRGDETVSVVRADSATWVLPRLDEYRVSQLHGSWGAEFQLTRTLLPYGETLIGSRRGITGHQSNPWLAFDDGTAGEYSGRVWSTVLAWSGTWRMTAERSTDDRVSVSTGFGHDPVEFALGPGATLETPVSAGLCTDGGFAASAAAWHDYVRGHVLAHPGEVRPVLYNSWEATGFDVSAGSQMKLAERAAALGCELFVMDDGWFGARVDDRAGLGDWFPNPDRFPEGLDPLIDHVHGLGLGFGIWVEPEMVNPDSDLYRSHPDWVYHRPHRRRSETRQQLVLNLARADVRDWAHDWLDRLLGEHGIDFVKWDMNRPFTEAGWPDAEDGDRLWIEHTRGYYALLDRLRADHPGVRIESCASGGGRVDLGVLARTDQVWTSDNTDAVDRLAIQEGFAQVYPAQVMGAWVTDSPNPFTGRPAPLEFRFHVAMAGALAVGGDLRRWSEDELARAAALVAEYKDVRETVQLGRRFPLRAGQVRGVQYHRGEESAVIAWRLQRRFGYPDPPLPLHGLDPAARYRDTATGRVHHGAILAEHGLDLGLADADPASALVRLRRIG
ncbi:alpha-galactosidase [Glycomyces paridis]|uniref:Alpha-galactosidase n=1 Tax=Glycomyces paridis TaxID=2126555 RepID=A0A4S8PHZ6_9ACTN|nr:alpha-galactosidase [Glycomyces paridis]THV29581.1 alpha-galactosidase [Glycomyces paridis]